GGAPLLALAPGGVCRAAQVALGAVRSYRTVSPLPSPSPAGAGCFLWHCPAGHPHRPLGRTPPRGARAFLPPPPPPVAPALPPPRSCGAPLSPGPPRHHPLSNPPPLPPPPSLDPVHSYTYIFPHHFVYEGVHTPCPPGAPKRPPSPPPPLKPSGRCTSRSAPG